ncbi:hypothetical protein AA0Z99_06250 [Agrococcus sp. 1P02AA]
MPAARTGLRRSPPSGCTTMLDAFVLASVLALFALLGLLVKGVERL